MRGCLQVVVSFCAAPSSIPSRACHQGLSKCKATGFNSKKLSRCGFA